MNTQISSQILYSPLSSSSGESEDTVSLDSSTTTPAPSLNNLLSEGAAVCLPQKRKAGRKKFKETRHPTFRGVRERERGKWVCELREPKKKSRIWLGTYPTAELAARAHDVAALALRGDKTALNFPNSAWLVPRAKSTSARDIRLAAFQATRFDLRPNCSPCQGNENTCTQEMEEIKSSTCYDNDDDVKSLKKNVVDDESKVLFMDEEAIFNVHTFIDSMAAGMLLTPPSFKRGINWDEIEEDNGDDDCFIDLDLWRYS
ncbi:dehydration-responsive element-binding protein 1F [Beta vulgaris subsp. vulgaris]|uniref:dehydration-responsive element-binding protein 1F n=1 Tax=Beta vulgaris subsp. vulgaris TaxID=3555 RepID=UPI002036E626|nr:dehydration-responsive element-binding protein 1F [Beta vulgaris subsp. vulgaris]